jgi:hypothetical protein
LIRVIAPPAGIQLGERMTMEAVPITLPTNPEDEFVLTATVDGQPQKVEILGNKWRITTSRMNQVGSHMISLKLLIQNIRAVGSLLKAVSALEDENLNLTRELNIETDPEVRQQIQARITLNVSNLESLRNQVDSYRREIGTPIEVSFLVN